MSGDDQSTRDLMKELDQEAVNLEASDALEQAHIDQERAEQAELENAADENASVREQEALDQANRELTESMEREAAEQSNPELEQGHLDEAPAVEQTGPEPGQSPLDASESQSTRDLMQELDQEAVNLEASDALEQAHIDQERREQRELEDAANDNSQAIADEEQARLDEAFQEMLEVEAREAASQPGSSQPSTVLRSVVLMVGVLALLYGTAALWRSSGRTSRSSAPVATVATPANAAPVRINSAVIDVEYIHKSGDWLDHTIKYSATAELNTDGGTGTGRYRERGRWTPSSEPPCEVTRSGDVTMRVTVLPDIREITAKIQGQVDRNVTGNPNCGANVDEGNKTDIVCVFQDVDIVRGGRYRAEDHPPAFEDGNINQETCTMVLAPIVP